MKRNSKHSTVSSSCRLRRGLFPELQHGANEKPEVYSKTQPLGGSNRSKLSRRRKSDIIYNMERGCQGEGSRLLAGSFIDTQLKSGPVKKFTPEEIAEYERGLKR